MTFAKAKRIADKARQLGLMGTKMSLSHEEKQFLTEFTRISAVTFLCGGVFKIAKIKKLPLSNFKHNTFFPNVKRFFKI